MQHKEKINPVLLDAINSRTHYLAENCCYPKLLGGGNFLHGHLNNHFIGTVNRMKRIHQIDDIHPKKYRRIKDRIQKNVDDIQRIESDNQKDIDSLACHIVRNIFDIPENIELSINGEIPFDKKDIFSNNQDSIEYSFDDYYGLEAGNNSIDRNRLQHAMIHGGANDCMWGYKPHENGLDNIDYRLGGLYDKYNSFNDFNLWVTPDEEFENELGQSDDGFKIYENDNGYRINATASNLPTKLHQLSKGVLSMLFKDRYNNSYVDYDNIWNARVGLPIWKTFKGMTKFKRNLPYIIDATTQLDDDDFAYTMKEVLAQTPHGKTIFETLNSRI